MSIKYSIENKKKYLFVKSHGKSNDLDEVSRYAREITELCKGQGHKNILIDETHRQYVLDEVLDLYKLATFFKTLDISSLRIAIICHPKYLEHIHFLETTANNRGMNIKFFLEFDSAKRWLL
ncbi:MAG: hypothetical protein GXP23_04215 [Gammaproteobacteria bacterium]|mgnify:CR=1 FL=1|nr:hypothetical protein [Gammaproteobacteria bacterium]